MLKNYFKTSAAINIFANSIGIVFLTGLSYLIISTAENVPVWDAWHNPRLFDLMFSGKLKFSDLYEEANGHRLLFPKIITLTLGYFSHYDVRWELLVNITLGATIFFLFKIFLADKLKQNNAIYFGAISCISILVFSLVQYENWYCGWQICIFLCIATSLLSLAILVLAKKSYINLLFAMVSAVIATYSFANGLIVWPLGALVLLCQKKSKGFAVAWLASAALFSFLYFYHFESSANFHITNLPEHIIYFLAYVGAPLAIESYFKAIIWAAAGLVVFIYLCWLAVKTATLRRHNLLLMVICVFSLASGLLISVARLGFGMEYALLSRYTSFSGLFWVSLCLMVFSRISVTPEVFEKKAAWFFVAMVLISSLRCSLIVKDEFDLHKRRMLLAINELKKEDLQNTRREAVKNITWDVDFTLEQAQILKKYKLSLYAE